MALSNTNRSFGSVTKTFHWLTALLILTIIPVGLVANDLAQAIRNPALASSVEDFTRAYLLFSLHKTLGVTIFFVALARILWAFTQPRPALLNGDNRGEAFAAQTVHWLLYGSLLLVPLTGWIDHAATTGYAPIRWPFGQSLPFVPKDADLAATFASLHIVLQRVFFVALALHIAGALKHHFLDRDATLARMLPGTAKAPPAPARAFNPLPPLAALALWGATLAIAFTLGAITPYARTPAVQSIPTEVASDWKIEEGTLDLVITQLGNRVYGSFGDWRASITFDETAGPGPVGRVEVTIAISSLSLGNVTAQAMGPDFFDADFFPEASFWAEIIRTDTGYEAVGPLVVRDTSLPVTLPFELTFEGDTARMSGTISLLRLDFGVGANMTDQSALGFGVDIIIDLTATRNK
jgi:cytochrome b561/polyisoprenoid-binding protein YceI